MSVILSTWFFQASCPFTTASGAASAIRSRRTSAPAARAPPQVRLRRSDALCHRSNRNDGNFGLSHAGLHLIWIRLHAGKRRRNEGQASVPPSAGRMLEQALDFGFRSVRVCLDVVFAAFAEGADGGEGVFHDLDIGQFAVSGARSSRSCIASNTSSCQQRKTFSRQIVSLEMAPLRRCLCMNLGRWSVDQVRGSP